MCVFCNVLMFRQLCVSVMCVLVFTAFCIVCTVILYCIFYIYFSLPCFVCTSARTTATGRKLNFSK
jgi:hypothetical protein